MTAKQLVLSRPNLSFVWANVFLRSMSRGAGDICPLVVTVTGFDENGMPEEDAAIRNALDMSLANLQTRSCHTVANTIFPERMWNPARPRQELFDKYERIWPLLKHSRVRRGEYPNKQGTYFRRFIAFRANDSSESINQLKLILDAWDAKVRRRSAFQAAVFDPRSDHKPDPYLKFPCLHQVGFVHVDGTKLHVTGFYGLQYVIKRAYGNYLGLCRLGRFMAHEMGLELTQLTCVAAAAKLEFNKCDLRDLANRVRGLLPPAELEQISSG